MRQPKRTKYRKAFKGRIKGNAKGGSSIAFGSFGLKALEPERVTARQIEATRRAVTREMKRQGKVWIRVFPDTPVTAKPIEVRMGKGKGSVDRYVAKIRPGRILYEMADIDKTLAVNALQLAAAKLPIKTRILCKEDDPWA